MMYSTLLASSVEYIGHCSERDWHEIQERLSRALALQEGAQS